MKIVIDPFDEKSITEAVRMVQQYQKDFKEKVELFTRRLADIGVRVASAGFASAEYDGNNDVVVSLKKTATGYAVIASGNAVGFIEFGTGVKNREWNSTGMDYTPPPHGSYGYGLGKSEYGWRYKGVPGTRGVLITEGKHAGEIHTYGNPPAEAMRSARDKMIEQVAVIAREVWR